MHLHPQDLEVYNGEMRKALGSKLFFVPHVPLHRLGLIVDFGCADGSVLKAIRATAPRASLIGVDQDPAQRHSGEQLVRDAMFVHTLGRALDLAKPRRGEPSLLILSSVLHELEDPRSFWRGVEELDFDYIAIRDYAVSAEELLRQTPYEWLEGVIIDGFHRHQLRDVSERYGTIATAYHFIHFLLKRAWVRDWEKELAEDYLRFTYEGLLDLITAGNYEAVCLKPTVTQHFVDACRKDFAIHVDFTTHMEVVLKRRKR